MRSKSFDGMACSIAGVLEAIGDRWAVLVLRDLSLGLARYEDLRRSTGVTNATLSDRLKHLEDNKLIERRRYQVNPERYEYVLTRKGRDTILLLQALAQVGDKWAVSGDAGPPLEFVNRKTGSAVKLAMVDGETGQRVRAEDLLPQAGPGADELVRWRSGGRRAGPLAVDAFPEIALTQNLILVVVRSAAQPIRLAQVADVAGLNDDHNLIPRRTANMTCILQVML